MSTEVPKTTPPPTTSQASAAHHKGVKIFTYPKIIFILPTFVASIICGIGMLIYRDDTSDPRKTQPQPAAASASAGQSAKADTPATAARVRRFTRPQNVLGMFFLVVFALNLLIMALDFPRFTIIAIILAAAAIGFFVLWLNVYLDLIPPLVAFLESIYTVANAGFYFVLATIMLVNFVIIYLTRFLDYWEILPNEILHNHGPFSDLERFPTFNLKFDKEIPDILEYAMLRAGKLVLHVASERKAIVLDNVLWIDSKEDELKKLMSRLEVRVTTDKEAAEPI